MILYVLSTVRRLCIFGSRSLPRTMMGKFSHWVWTSSASSAFAFDDWGSKGSSSSGSIGSLGSKGGRVFAVVPVMSWSLVSSQGHTTHAHERRKLLALAHLQVGGRLKLASCSQSSLNFERVMRRSSHLEAWFEINCALAVSAQLEMTSVMGSHLQLCRCLRQPNCLSDDRCSMRVQCSLL